MYRRYHTIGIVRLLPLEYTYAQPLLVTSHPQRLSVPQLPDCQDLDLMIRLWSTTWFTVWSAAAEIVIRRPHDQSSHVLHDQTKLLKLLDVAFHRFAHVIGEAVYGRQRVLILNEKAYELYAVIEHTKLLEQLRCASSFPWIP